MNKHHAQAGFGIVEVMVALVVLAVGMLGIASLYVTTLQSSGSAISRMQAVNLAGDLADRIRANRFAGLTYGTPNVEEQHDCIGATDCSQDDMAKNDMFLWQKQIQALLPGGTSARGTVAFTAGAGTVPDDYIITVNWVEASRGKEQDAADGDTGTPGTQLRYVLRMQIEP